MNAPLPEHIRRALDTVTLDDKYSLDEGRAFMSGVQALVKLPMLQRQRDALQGKNTAGFISGYRMTKPCGKPSLICKRKTSSFNPG
jgi:indolepyruvate ferredoxin oxidoreductase